MPGQIIGLVTGFLDVALLTWHNAGLQGSGAATTVQIKDGKQQVLNGPYADSKEQLGGYFLIDAPDLDAAISWAARCPGASHGIVEVRPVWAM